MWNDKNKYFIVKTNFIYLENLIKYVSEYQNDVQYTKTQPSINKNSFWSNTNSRYIYLNKKYVNFYSIESIEEKMSDTRV